MVVCNGFDINGLYMSRQSEACALLAPVPLRPVSVSGGGETDYEGGVSLIGPSTFAFEEDNWFVMHLSCYSGLAPSIARSCPERNE